MSGNGGTRRRLRLVHTADVHLGEMPGAWSGVAADAVEQAFVRVIDTVLAERADALLIAGDLFDSNRVPEPAVRFAAAQLGRLSCPVVLIPGNHDCYDQSSVYRRFDFAAVGPHVHPLYAEDGELVAFEHLGLTVWGKGLVEHDPHNRPLEGAPGRDAERPDASHWMVGLAHGHFVEDRRELRSSLITAEEIAGCGLDYLALGHVHVFRDVSQGAVRACYPGAPRVSYAPDAGSLALITLEPGSGVAIEPRRLAE